MSRVLVIGVQEITRDLIDPWVARGLLPNIARLMQAGASGRVRAEAPVITPHNWANVFAGVDAGLHGVFDYWQRGASGQFRETSPADLKSPPLWERLRNTGLRSTFVNLPLTCPPPDIDGVVVAAPHGGPVQELFSPPELYDRLAVAHGPYQPEATSPGGRKQSDYVGLFDRETPRTAAAFEFLLQAEPWDFAMVYFIDAAMAQHYFWADMAEGGDNPYRDVILSAYRNIDTAIGRLLAAAGDGTVVFVVSECGAGPLRSGVNLNNWLERQGLLTSRHTPLDAPKRFIEDRLLPVAKRALPPALKSALAERSSVLKNWASSSGTQLDLDWSRTKAFSRGKEGNLYVNLAGRDPHGMVEPGAEYDALLATLAEGLSALRDPTTGAPVVTRVARPVELYSAPQREYAPDLIVDWADAAYMMTERGGADGEVFAEQRWRKGMSWPTTGGHRYDGVLIAAGPGIAAGKEFGHATHFDLLPTWLSLLGRPLATEFRGRVLTEIMES